MSEYKASGKLEGKKALITGGDSGIGRSVAICFAKEGCDVVIVYLPKEEKDAQQTKNMVEKEGKSCWCIAKDISSEENCREIIETAVEKLGGKIDILVNNAAHQMVQTSIEDISTEQLEQTFKVNIFAQFWCVKHALKYMPEKTSSIINSTSVVAYKGSKHLLDYSATKGAIVAFTRSLALNLAPKGIRVNGVAPGPIWTPLQPASRDEENMEQWVKKTPALGRIGQPAEVAPSYVFLASADGAYFTGQVLHPNGGMVVNA